MRRLIETLDFEIDLFAGLARARLTGDAGYRAVQTLPGVGPTLAAVFVAEIGDVTRFGRPEQLTCWAGLTPKHRESDTRVHRGRITKQGSPLVRWAAVESVQTLSGNTPVGSYGTGSPPAVVATSVSWLPHAANSSSCSSHCATITSGLSSTGHGGSHELHRKNLVGAGRAGHDPRS